MRIYIGNLSSEITSIDLAKFFSGFGKQLRFEFKYYVKGEKRFYYASTSIEHRKSAEKAIKRRNLKRINNRVVMVRAYKERGIFNERRALNWREKIWEAEERRVTERRTTQYSKIVKDKQEQFRLTPAPHF